MADRLASYRGKRRFAETPEPSGADESAAGEGARFAVQEHHATRLHWDLRLERDGVLASWAIPNGLPDSPGENRKAVRTEDHPLEYLTFEGEIPKGSYGAGRVMLWDQGTYDELKWTSDKVEVRFHGERLNARYALFRAGGERDWMIHRMDAPEDPDREPLPDSVVPMLARAGPLPREDDRYAYEIKWDGVRALVFSRPGRLRIVSRTLRDVTATYPELRRLNRALSDHVVLLDGEIVAFDEQGRPSFERLQRRMGLGSEAAARRAAREVAVAYVIFDLLHLDGHSLMEQPWEQRREALEALALDGPAWQTPAARRRGGAELLDAVAARGLEGVVAKRLDAPYEPGRRSGAWIKVKRQQRQELVIGGWMTGEGRRARTLGALLLGVREDGRLRYAGRVGTGFSDAMLEQLQVRLAELERPTSPFGDGDSGDAPVPKQARFVEPELVAEVEFTEWTRDGVLRHPSFKGLRDDKEASEVVREDGSPLRLAEGRAVRGGIEVEVEGRRLKLTNLDKAMYPPPGFTKGEVIDYYARIAPVLLPHLRDRPLTLKRYPDGVEGQPFFQKQCAAHRPDWVETAPVRASRKTIDFCLAQDLPTLVWTAQLAAIELHPSLSRAPAVERPTMLVFDLDPGPPADIVACCEVALALRGLFEQLGLQSFAKTSGSKGLQLYVPLNREEADYEQTKGFALRVAETLEARFPELVVSRMRKDLRGGKVLIDWSQNDESKTTVAVYSLRARARPTVSTPVEWAEVEECRERRDATLLRFEAGEVLDRVARDGDRFAPVLSLVQALPALD